MSQDESSPPVDEPGSPGDPSGESLVDAVTAEPGPGDDAAPGEGAVEEVAELWPPGAAAALRQRWQDLQLRFVDDPHNAAAEADFLVGSAVETLTASLAALRTDLSGWRERGSGDTEQLRVAVRRYREFLDRILVL